jgi:hypothetical protein
MSSFYFWLLNGAQKAKLLQLLRLLFKTLQSEVAAGLQTAEAVGCFSCADGVGQLHIASQRSFKHLKITSNSCEILQSYECE